MKAGVISPWPVDQVPTSGALYWTAAMPDTAGPVVVMQNNHGEAVWLFGGPQWLAEWVTRQETEWTGPDKRVVEAFYARKKDPEKAPKKADRPLLAHEVFAQNAELAHFDLIADLTATGLGTMSGAVLFPDVEESLTFLSMRYDCMRANSGSIRLLRPLEVLTKARGSLVPGYILQDLRTQTRRNRGYLTVSAFLRLSEFSYPQLASLVQEFGSVNVNTDQLREHGVWRAILSFVRALPDADRLRAIDGEAIVFGTAPDEARKLLTDATESYHLEMVRRLNENPNARVAVRIQSGPVMVFDKGARSTVEGRNLIWEITFPDGKVVTRRYPLHGLAPDPAP